MASSIERVTVNLPVAYDPNRHQAALLRYISQKHGEGWEIESIDPTARIAIATRQVSTTEVTAHESAKNTKVVRLARGTKPADGDKVAARLEDQNPGYYLTAFEPFLGKATLTKMTDAQARCRGAVAVALGVKPWDVQVSTRSDGGFDLVLPRTYVPSKHDDKLAEVAEVVVGQPGWYVTVNTQTLHGSIIPSDPPTFPEVLPTNFKQLGANPDHTPIGLRLPPPGQEFGTPLAIDWTASAHMMLAGTPGSGKSVTLNAIIADALAAGTEVVIVDDPAKAVDFLWCKDFVRDGGWGCDSDRGAVATLAMVYEEGQRRAKMLADSGYENWLDMPRGQRFTPILVIVDEVSALLVTDKVPTGVSKTHPMVQEILEANLMKVALGRFITKIIAELRFVGIRMVISTQVTNASTGVPPSLKAKIGHKVLQGANPSKAARVQAFSDETAVPTVPENVRAGGKRARGVGAADLEGQGPAVYKSFFASTRDYQAELGRRGAPRTTRPAPTPAEIAKHTPSLDDDGPDDRPPSKLDGGGWGERDGRDAPAPRLRGAAAAAHQLRVEAAQAGARTPVGGA